MGVQYNALVANTPPQVVPPGVSWALFKARLGSAGLLCNRCSMDSEETVVADQDQAATMVAEPKKKDEKKKREVPRYHVRALGQRCAHV